MNRAEARELLRDLVEEVAGELDDEDGAWLVARWRRFDGRLDEAPPPPRPPSPDLPSVG